MAVNTLRSEIQAKQQVPAASPEVDFALVLSRVITSVKENPAELRHAIYELARIKLQQEGWQRNPPIDILEMRRLSMALETAIERVEAISSKDEQQRAITSLDRLIGNLDEREPEVLAPPSFLVVDDNYPLLPATTNRTLSLQRLKYASSSLSSQTIHGLLAFMRLRGALVAGAFLIAILSLAAYRQFAPNILSGSRTISTGSIESSARDVAAASKPPAEQVRAPSPAEQDQLRGFPLPSVYGIYAVSDGQLHELEPLPGRAPDQRIFMSAIINKPSRTVIPAGPISFLAYRRDLATNAPDRVSVRVIARVARAMSVNSGGQAQVTPVNDAWAIRNVAYDFRVAPLRENSEMLVMRPEKSDFTLSPGRYAVVLNGLPYDFTIEGKVTNVVHCLERTTAANGVFYSECRAP